MRHRADAKLNPKSAMCATVCRPMHTTNLQPNLLQIVFHETTRLCIGIAPENALACILSFSPLSLRRHPMCATVLSNAKWNPKSTMCATVCSATRTTNRQPSRSENRSTNQSNSTPKSIQIDPKSPPGAKTGRVECSEKKHARIGVLSTRHAPSL